MHIQEERFENIKKAFTDAHVLYIEKEGGILELFSSYIELKQKAPWCLNRIRIQDEAIFFEDEECMNFFELRDEEELTKLDSKYYQKELCAKQRLIDSRTKYIQQFQKPSLLVLVYLLEKYSIPYRDNTRSGGAFWIEGELDSLDWLVKGLESIGFELRFVSHRRRKNLPAIWVRWN